MHGGGRQVGRLYIRGRIIIYIYNKNIRKMRKALLLESGHRGCARRTFNPKLIGRRRTRDSSALIVRGCITVIWCRPYTII